MTVLYDDVSVAGPDAWSHALTLWKLTRSIVMRAPARTRAIAAQAI